MAIDITDRLRFDASRCEVQFSKGVASNIEEAIVEIERLRAAFDVFSKAVNLPEGPSLAIQRHDPSWDAWKKLCDAFSS